MMFKQLFKPNKWDLWYEQQPQHIKDWFDQDRPIWYDRDIVKFALIAFFVGLLIGLSF